MGGTIFYIVLIILLFATIRYFRPPEQTVEEKSVTEFVQELKNNKTFDLILIDAPIGGDMKVYSRIDVLSLIPEYLGNQFVIILDDVNRMQEKRTIREIDNKLKESGIQAKHEIYSGEKETCVWASENWDFLLSM